VDANVVAYLVFGADRTALARRAHQADPDWAAPGLWRSEIRNTMATYMKRKEITLGHALLAFIEAESLFDDRDYLVDTMSVLALAASSGCSACDCEYVALAQDLGVPLVTTDRALVKAFPSIAVSLEALVRR
jgi:predicted nucleic acid-binding protein